MATVNPQNKAPSVSTQPPIQKKAAAKDPVTTVAQQALQQPQLRYKENSKRKRWTKEEEAILLTKTLGETWADFAKRNFGNAHPYRACSKHFTKITRQASSHEVSDDPDKRQDLSDKDFAAFVKYCDDSTDLRPWPVFIKEDLDVKRSKKACYGTAQRYKIKIKERIRWTDCSMQKVGEFYRNNPSPTDNQLKNFIATKLNNRYSQQACLDLAIKNKWITPPATAAPLDLKAEEIVALS